MRTDLQRSFGLPIAAAVLLVACDDAARPLGLLRPDDEILVAAGADVYAQHCAACHGASLEGQPDWQARGPDGLLPAPPHDETGHTWHHSDKALFEMTKFGPQRFAGPDYQSAMPGYEGVLTDEQIVAVLSYIKSAWPPEIRTRQDAITASE